MDWYGQSMRKPALLVVVVAALIGLAGCAGAPSDEADMAAPTVEEVEEAAPLTAEQPAEEASADTPEAAFLEAVRETLNPEKTQIPDASDAQLLAAGNSACEQIASGVLPIEVRVIENETPNGTGLYADSRTIGHAASETICA